uniref:helix-turn-helix domain-containing protein n=1 Tax=Paractinoplanes polyasparticus TaxID=2856853 RepID=UPI0021041AFF|nr:helix-turn-helix domain-containing protein [Actinoplanes polyasparticus]
MFFNILTTFTEFEGDLLPMRTRKGMSIAKAKGRLRGRAPKLSSPRQAHLLKLHAIGEHTVAELAELAEVSHPTVYRVLKRAQSESSAA